MPPSLTTEAKTLKPIAFTTTEAVSHLRNGGSMLLPATAAFAPQHMPDCTIPLYAGSDVSSILSLIEDMAKALEAFSNLSEVFKHRTVTRPASGDDPIFAWADHRVNDGEALVITVGDLMKARSALSRYTEFMEQNNG